MNELSKRWARVDPKGGGTRWVLREKGAKWNWALAYRDAVSAEWQLRIWDGGDWGKPINVPTLRDAKALGRILAATAMR
jgi:hypothetical protein